MLRSSQFERLRSSVVSEDAAGQLSQANTNVRPIHVYSLVQKFRTQDMVTRGELVEIITRQKQEGSGSGKLLDSHTCMDYCVESMEETYCSTSSS